ncbi:MAG TPA: hypothetical protein PK264_19705 [Hyphomicrobiaceae bacterium]|nr:hypothetical protein [Hyphomicrobiaceae bacterium]
MLKTMFASLVAAGALTSLVALGSAPSEGAGFSSRPPSAAKICKGKGKDRQCLACVIADGIKDCFWYAAPSKG